MEDDDDEEEEGKYEAPSGFVTIVAAALAASSFTSSVYSIQKSKDGGDSVSSSASASASVFGARPSYATRARSVRPPKRTSCIWWDGLGFDVGVGIGLGWVGLNVGR